MGIWKANQMAWLYAEGIVWEFYVETSFIAVG